MNIVSMLHNQTTGRYHPILFYYAPPPSGDTAEMARYRSKGHHTIGFDDRDTAVFEAADIARRTNAKMACGGDIVWPGDELPAMTCWFADLNGVLQPVL